MSKLAFLTLTAAACCSLFRAADGVGTGSGSANQVNPLNDPTGSAATKIGKSRHRIVVILETTGDPEKVAREAVELLQGDGTEITAATLQSQGYRDRDLLQDKPQGGATALAANTIQGEEQTGKTPGRETLNKAPVVPQPAGTTTGEQAGRIGETGPEGARGEPGETGAPGTSTASRAAADTGTTSETGKTGGAGPQAPGGAQAEAGQSGSARNAGDGQR